MPRRHVPPEERQRVYQACLSCKASKKRCDSKVPCGPCLKRDRGSSCTYPGPTNRRRLSMPRYYATRNRLPPEDSESVIEVRHVLDPEKDPLEFSGNPTTDENAVCLISVSQATSARMLLNAKGERGMKEASRSRLTLQLDIRLIHAHPYGQYTLARLHHFRSCSSCD